MDSDSTSYRLFRMDQRMGKQKYAFKKQAGGFEGYPALEVSGGGR